MEGRAHCKEKYARDGQVSFMEADLRRCEDDFASTFKPRPATRAPLLPPTGNGAAKPHVCVVGAGLAGLRSAEILLAKGFRVTILEGKDHVGGRTSQTTWNGGLIDVGASWMHGTENNPINDMAKATSTAISVIPDTTLAYSPAGNILPADAVEKGLDKIWELISDAFRESNLRGDAVDPRKSLKDYFIERLRGDPPEDRDLTLLQAEQWGGFIGDEWEKQSLRWFWLEECLDGDNLFVSGTHRRIVKSIADPVASHPDCTLRLSATVKSIASTTAPRSRNPSVSVLTNVSAEPLVFDEIVVAIPLGCLKRDYVSFSPPLDPKITRAIAHAGISSFEKVYLAFTEAFWDRVESDEVARGVGAAGTEDAEPGTKKTPCFVHFLAPEYVPAGQPAWSMEFLTMSSAAVFGAYAQPTILVQTYGAPAARVVSLIRGLAPDSPEYVSALGEFFRPYLARLPGYRAGDPACVPAAGFSTNWHDDALGGHGSYTNFKTSDTAPGEVVLDEDIGAMRHGEPERGIWFAGEHTAPFLGQGTTTGAYWSGECTAMRIAAAHGMAGAPAGKNIKGANGVATNGVSANGAANEPGKPVAAHGIVKVATGGVLKNTVANGTNGVVHVNGHC